MASWLFVVSYATGCNPYRPLQDERDIYSAPPLYQWVETNNYLIGK